MRMMEYENIVLNVKEKWGGSNYFVFCMILKMLGIFKNFFKENC